MAQSFMNKQHFYELLEELGVTDLLQFDVNETFAAECSFLQQWNERLNQQPDEDGLSDIAAERASADAADVYVKLDYGKERVMIAYEPDVGYPGRPAVAIFHNRRAVYGRVAGQSTLIDFCKNPFFD